MKRAIILIVLLGIAASTGCALFERTSPEQRWAAAATLYTRTLNSLTQLKVAGVLDDEDKARIEPYRAAARAAIDRMGASIAADVGDFDAAWDAFSAAIDVMLREQAKAGGAE